MTTPYILVVEDNPITRKLLRVTLEAEGYQVREAENGQAALAQFAYEPTSLVLQDLVLPDMNGFDLARRLRALPRASAVQVIAVTGLLSRADEARPSTMIFDDVLIKPVEPSHLIEVVSRFSPLPKLDDRPGRGRSVLVVDDDPVGQKLARHHLTDRGFRVAVAANGAEALELARRDRPDAILSDVMMPEVDGFRLCQFVRQDLALQRLPVVLTSAHYLDHEDALLAQKVGANALVPRHLGIQQACDVLLRALDTQVAPPASSDVNLSDEHLARVMVQLERQTRLCADYAQRCAVQAASLTIIRQLCDLLGQKGDLDASLEDVLYTVFDLANANLAALYLVDEVRALRMISRAEPAASDAFRQFFAGWSAVARTLECGDFVLTDPLDLQAQRVLNPYEVRSGVLVPLLAHGQRIGVLLLGFDGCNIPDEDHISMARTAGVQIGQAIALRRAFESASRAEQRYRGLLENATDGVWILSPEGRLLEANRRVEEIHARPRSEMIGRHFMELVASDDVDSELRRFDELIRHGAVRADNVKILRADGKATFADISAILVNLGNEEVVIAIEHDATERRKMEAQLRQAQKMEAIGQLTGGIAHDFNNVLAVILANAQFLQEEITDPDPRREYVDEVRFAVERAAALTRQLLAFSRRQVLELVNLDLNAVVRGTEKLLRRLIGEDIELVMGPTAAAATVRADTGQIEQVIMNLALNARDAMPTGGCLIIETANVMLDGSYAAAHLPVQPGPYVMLAVSDTGCGMDAETQLRIFEPFFTTKEKSKGTGLGLSTCYGIVKQSGGYIWVYSEPGHGTVFKIYLPQIDARPRTTTRRPPARDLNGTETVLLVEDDAGVRDAVNHMLTTRGYRVLAARDGNEAVSIARRQSLPVDLVLSDVVVPGPNGPEIVSRIQEMLVGTKAIFMSGYTDHAVLRSSALQLGTNFIQKPFAAEALARKIREVLDA